MLAAATAGSFMTNHPTFVSIAIIVIVFSTAAIGSLITWTWVGSALRHWLSVGSRMRTFNLAMGVFGGYRIVADGAVIPAVLSPAKLVQLIDEEYDAGIYLAERHPQRPVCWPGTMRKPQSDFRRFSIGKLFRQLPLKTLQAL
jgi:hypothetical protein